MLKRFFGYYRPYRRLFILDFGCAVFAGLLELAFPVAVNQVIDKIMPKGDFRLIALASAGLFAFYIINTFLQFIVVYFGHMLGVNIETDMREELYQHLQTQPFEYYDNQKTGKLMSRLTTDLFEISEVAHHGPEDVFITIMTLAGSFLLMLTIHVKLAIATFILLANIFIRPIEKVNNMIESYPKGFAGFKRFTEEMDKQPSIKDLPGAVAVSHLEGTIAYKDVSFAYEDGTKVLDHINLKIQPGETVAFVGQSGSGKTTLCNLLPRFYEVSSGEITIDGRNIQKMTLASLRKQIGIVQQDVFLFPGTLRENIAYGNLNATEIDIQQAVKLAHLEHVIQLMPDGLDTIIGERGVKLSGGQKQRVAIARMFLKNPPILILDEATSALDTETEQVIQESLNSLANGRTTLIIAHRLATIKHADRIIVVSDQGILEDGTHETLYAQRGHYRRLYDAQFRT